MDNKQSLIDAEIARIKAGPQSGAFTFLHHEGPVIEESKNVMERVSFILQNKPPSEILARLQHIYYVPLELLKAYREATAAAGETYREATAPAWESLPGGHSGSGESGIRDHS